MHITALQFQLYYPNSREGQDFGNILFHFLFPRSRSLTMQNPGTALCLLLLSCSMIAPPIY